MHCRREFIYVTHIYASQMSFQSLLHLWPTFTRNGTRRGGQANCPYYQTSTVVAGRTKSANNIHFWLHIKKKHIFLGFRCWIWSFFGEDFGFFFEVFRRCSGGWQSAGPMSLAKASDNGRLKDWANWSRLKRSPTICFFSSFLIISSHHIVNMFSHFWDLLGCISCLWLFEWGCATVQHEKISSVMEVAMRYEMFTHSVCTAYTVYTAYIAFTAQTVYTKRLLCPYI